MEDLSRFPHLFVIGMIEQERRKNKGELQNKEFIEWLPHTKSCSKFLTCTSLLYSHNNLTG